MARLFSLWLFISVFSTFQPLHFSFLFPVAVSHSFSPPLSLCLHLSLFFFSSSSSSSHCLSLISLSASPAPCPCLFSLSPSLPGRRRDDGFVAVVTPSFSLPLLAPAASPNDDTQIQQFSHVEMI